MRLRYLALAGATILAMPALAFAEDAVVVGNPPPPPGQTVVVHPGNTVVAQPAQPCRTHTTTKTNDNTGESHTKQTTNCPD